MFSVGLTKTLEEQCKDLKKEFNIDKYQTKINQQKTV
jgi:hypothetical protein